MNVNSKFAVSIFVDERDGIGRVSEPVTLGVPFPRGAVIASNALTVCNRTGHESPVQVSPLSRWSDGSVRWALLDFKADVDANSQSSYRLRAFSQQSRLDSQLVTIAVEETAEHLIVDTGKARFFLNRKSCKPFDRVLVMGRDVLGLQGSSLKFIDEAGETYVPEIADLAIETAGRLRTTIRAKGVVKSGSRAALARFVMRVSFHSGSGFVDLTITFHNPKAASHRGGLWDLGDSGSIYFKDCSLHLPLVAQDSMRIGWTPDPSQPLRQVETSSLEIYQDSSGGENWQSTNHVNRYGKVMHSFQGYRVIADGSPIETGLRASPIIGSHGQHGAVYAAIEKFWQNFPKGLEVSGHELILRLFPRQYSDVFELQGGEQKTHRMYLQFTGPDEPPVDLRWVHNRLIPRATPEWYAESKAVSYISPRDQDSNMDCQELIDQVISGPRSFFARRETIDEYGWRHFGDLYADHEAVGHVGDTPLVAHYNNQYDVIYGAIVQYLRGGDWRWFELMADLARHVIDIDIYHTEEDRASYNGGLFWHTDHYLDAGTATHRTYSKTNLEGKDPRYYGGGPANEHNYTSGLLHYYFLSGDETAREAVLSLANWVINLDDGSHRTFGFFDRRPTGMASSTTNRDYHGPGRGAGNSINALMDGYTLSGKSIYLAKVEELIRRCIHPQDDISSRNLDDPEHRWSYLVFLQVLGKFLDYKVESGNLDYMYGYARASLIHYADWMSTHEVPYSTVLQKVELPTETWPAQDIRKSVVFHYAEKHSSGPKRDGFMQKAEYFFAASINDLKGFPTHTLARPLVLLMTNAHVHPYFKINPAENAPLPNETHSYNASRRFKPQFAELYSLRNSMASVGRLLQKGMRWIGGAKRERQIVLGAPDG